jgi:uncharacterized protein YndB with AHSA1/START domain
MNKGPVPNSTEHLLDKVNFKTKKLIVLKIAINGELHDVWNTWINPNDIVNWYSGHQDWFTSESINNLQVGKSFTYVLNSKDGKDFFPFKGVYIGIDEHNTITYLMEDDRRVETSFHEVNNTIMIIQKVEIEDCNPVNIEALWWRTILLNFKKYIEN